MWALALAGQVLKKLVLLRCWVVWGRLFGSVGVPRDKLVVAVVKADWAPWAEVEAMMMLCHFQPLSGGEAVKKNEQSLSMAATASVGNSLLMGSKTQRRREVEGD